METGRVIKFDHGKGYGFVEPDNGTEDLFVHVNDLLVPESQMRLGVAVDFEIEVSHRGRRAVNVSLSETTSHLRLASVTPEASVTSPILDKPAADAADAENITAHPLEQTTQAGPSPILLPTSVEDGEQLIDVLSVAEYTTEITEVLLAAAPEITSWQVLQLRQALSELAQDHGWVDPTFEAAAEVAV